MPFTGIQPGNFEFDSKLTHKIGTREDRRRKECWVGQIALAWTTYDNNQPASFRIIPTRGKTSSKGVAETVRSSPLTDAGFDELNEAIKCLEKVGSRCL